MTASLGDVGVADDALNFGTLALSATLAICLVFSVTLVDQLTWSRLLVVLFLLLGWHLLLCPRLFVFRELYLYSGFTLYAIITGIWAPDFLLALNTLFPVVDCLVLMVLVSALVAYHDKRSVFIGTLGGLLLATGYYTYTIGFPIHIPENFSYNAIASVYLFGIFSVLLYGCYTRSIALPALLALLMLLQVAATTSIKTNMGVLVAAVAVTFFYFRQAATLTRRYSVYLLLGFLLLVYLVVTTEGAIERLQLALARVEVGLKVLQAREDQSGYQGFDERAYWFKEGLTAWTRNPIFGAGVEAFRFRFGITSHSSFVDLLYNTGLIGFGLFYSIFASLAWRLLRAPSSIARGPKAIVLAVLAAYSFISLSGVVFYQVFLAFLFATSAVFLIRGTEPR